ncbi:MAG: acetyl-CoA C-acyltransferase [Actinobacteria bacterium]|nr:MAG: acetyl-CoA C-acyltransferase [Actinomycetota bacterium]
MNSTVRRVAVLGGSRIPFARQNGPYARASNQDMMTTALNAVVEKFGLAGERLDEVAAGAVLKHSRDFNLSRESVLGSKLAPETPAYDVQQACGTGLEATILVANKIALGQADVAVAGGVDTTSDAPLALNEDLREILLEVNRTKSNAGRLRALAKLRPQQLVPEIPRNAEPRTGLSMGEHCAIMAREWGVGREEQDELAVRSHRKLAEAYDSGWLDDVVVPFLGLERDQNLRPDASVERLAQLKPVFDYVHKREGLLMAPAYAMPRMLQRAGIKLQDFDFYEIHEAFAAQVLCTLKAWEDERFCSERLGLDEPLGSVDRDKLNVHGGSLGAGHPFGATGGRIVAGLAKLLSENGSGRRGVISICAAGGLGVTAIMEAA